MLAEAPVEHCQGTFEVQSRVDELGVGRCTVLGGFLSLLLLRCARCTIELNYCSYLVDYHSADGTTEKTELVLL